jgi:hypothetical protein
VILAGTVGAGRFFPGVAFWGSGRFFMDKALHWVNQQCTLSLGCLKNLNENETLDSSKGGSERWCDRPVH